MITQPSSEMQRAYSHRLVDNRELEAETPSQPPHATKQTDDEKLT
jgi:hypothetical protein